MNWRTVVLALGLATLCLAVLAPAVSAECMNWPLERDDRPNMSFVFTATVYRVTERSDDSYRYWTLSLVVDEALQGDLPRELEIQDSNVGCSFLDARYIVEGDRLLIATERIESGQSETDLGNVFMWKGAQGRWTFFEDALREGSDRDYYPTAIRSATTTRDILRALSRRPTPETSTVATAKTPGTGMDPRLSAVAFVVGLMIAARRFRPHRTASVLAEPPSTTRG